MIPTSQILESIVEEELSKLKDFFPHNSYYAIQFLIRSLDNLSLFYNNNKKVSEDIENENRTLIDFGWSKAVRAFYEDLDLKTTYPLPQSTDHSVNWANSMLIHAGKLDFCRQIIDYEKAGTIELISPKKNEFTFKPLRDHVGIEYFDRLSVDFFKKEIIERMIEDKKSRSKYNEGQMKEVLKGMITNPFGELISYNAPPELGEYYNEVGHYHILRTQGYDDFATTDTFGGIPYWKYVDLIEITMGGVHMHTDACLELCQRNSNVKMHNILSYAPPLNRVIDEQSNYLGVSKDEVRQILSCYTLTKENFKHYLSQPGVPPPIYFQVGENLLIRSAAGCLNNPLKILNSELKRKFKRDYDIAVNNREKRFREELFVFFPQERIVKIPNEIRISFNGAKTDIDAILYDSQTKTLALFQLKWQDPFGHSMKERYSRISNLFPKANEWVDKMRFWVMNNDAKTILNALQINKYDSSAKEIKDLCVFVMARSHMNFSGANRDADPTVAWGSWYQFIEAHAKVKTTFDDPIKEMFIKLKTLSPEQRIAREEMPARQPFDIRFGDYRLYYNEE